MRVVGEGLLRNPDAIQGGLERGWEGAVIGLRGIDPPGGSFHEDADTATRPDINSFQGECPFKEPVAESPAGVFRMLLLPIACINAPFGMGPVPWFTAQDSQARDILTRRGIAIGDQELDETAGDLASVIPAIGLDRKRAEHRLARKLELNGMGVSHSPMWKFDGG